MVVAVLTSSDVKTVDIHAAMFNAHLHNKTSSQSPLYDVRKLRRQQHSNVDNRATRNRKYIWRLSTFVGISMHGAHESSQ